jgi:cytochrome c5
MKCVRKYVVAVVLGLGAFTCAGSSEKNSAAVQPQTAVSANDVNQEWMLEGEKRYRVNCVRCHQAPHKFPPRAMATVVRHMRVRAMLTEDDMQYVLYYMTH